MLRKLRGEWNRHGISVNFTFLPGESKPKVHVNKLDFIVKLTQEKNFPQTYSNIHAHTLEHTETHSQQ